MKRIGTALTYLIVVVLAVALIIGARGSDDADRPPSAPHSSQMTVLAVDRDASLVENR